MRSVGWEKDGEDLNFLFCSFKLKVIFLTGDGPSAKTYVYYETISLIRATSLLVLLSLVFILWSVSLYRLCTSIFENTVFIVGPHHG